MGGVHPAAERHPGSAATFDTIVIGSGPGGLTAALALARAGQKVLVLEQHYLPGGWTHSFTLEGYRFSPGVHYIGGLEDGGGVRRLYEGLGLSEDLEFCEMNPDGFDHFTIAGERFDQPKGADRWKRRLIARFPNEREGIERYFRTIDALVEDLKRSDESLMFPAVLTLPLRAPTLVRWGLSTLDALLDSCVRDPMLKAVLSAQCGNHGLAPSRVSLPLHASMTSHYYGGAYYPRGGAKRIASAYIKALRRHRGKIRMSARVARILVEAGRAIGVMLEDGEEILCNDVVCNADPAVTYGKLLPHRLCARAIRKVKRSDYSVGVMSVFCAVDMDLRGRGYDSGNYWWYRTPDVEGTYRRMERELPGAELEGIFVAITSLKDPTQRAHGHHTVEMFTFVPYEPFARNEGGSFVRPSAAYEALKHRLGDQMLTTAEHVIPGLRRHLKFVSVGTPTTNDFYCATFRGAAYGTAKTPWQIGPFSFDMEAPVKHLTMCGASTLAHGVASASLSGLWAAQRVLGVKSAEACLGAPDGSLRIYPADAPTSWRDDRGEQVAVGSSAASELAPG